jgi:hypothetical protein
MPSKKSPPAPVIAPGDWWQIRAAADPRSAEL